MRGRKYKTSEFFLRQLKEIHGEKYDTSKVIYTSDRDEVILGCKIHGEFKKKPNHLLRGQGCPECGKIKKGLSRRNSLQEFIDASNKTHNFQYDYSKVELTTTHKKVIIICKIHGEFLQTPASHQFGCGCPHCYEKTRGASQKFNQEIFIAKAKAKHGDKYDYSKTCYVNSQRKVIIICSNHGEFEQVANSHLKYGCQMCANGEINKKLRLTNDEFIRRCSEVHHNKYDYSKTEYVTGLSRITIICPKHGEFEQVAHSHLYAKKACPKCKSSHGEVKVRNWLKENGYEFKEQKTFNTCRHKRPLKFDFWIPSHNLLIEYDGIQHFPDEIYLKYKTTFSLSSELNKIRDDIKTKWCEEYQVNLLRIKYSDDVVEKLENYFKFLNESQLV